ncbi:DNA-binding protein [Undibacterium sp. SXout7W]|uniref:DNA-binding protein n=1 Tax=Undibacterium sp. SXout7W TaxID=3413049 RepID=UPI003BF08330
MARSGILYSDVAKAAETLNKAGKGITVDNIRETLGNTGSKSTIGPMLKQWKNEHLGKLTEIESRLPPMLLQALQDVYDLVQQNAQLLIDSADEQCQQQIATMQLDVQGALSEKATVLTENEKLVSALNAETDKVTSLQTDNQRMQVELASLRSEKTGLLTRLKDRETEVDGLHQQISMSRSQFDHFQEATAIQRTQERQAYESRINKLEYEMNASRQQILEQQMSLSHQSAQIIHLNQSNAILQEQAGNLQQTLALTYTERDQYNSQLTELQSRYKDLSSNLASIQEIQSANSIAIASKEEKIAMLNGQLTELRSQNLSLQETQAEYMKLFKDLTKES